MRTDGRGVLLTGGRAPAALELARAFADAGWRVHAAESIRRHLCRSSRAVAGSHLVPAPADGAGRYAAALAEIAAREGLRTLVPACEEVFHIAGQAELLAARGCRVLAPPLARLAQLHSKWAFIQLAASYGFDVPKTRLLTSAAEWRQAAEQTGEKLVLKPVYSRFAAHVTIVGAGGQWEAFAGMKTDGVKPQPQPGGGFRADPARTMPDISQQRPWVAQQYIAGRELCAYAVAHEGRLSAWAVYASHYKAGRGATVYFEALRHPELREWVERFVELEKFTGQIAFDFIETDAGRLYPLECNPRATSGVHLFRGDGARLAAALVEPEQLRGVCLEPRPGAKAMLALPMLAAGLAADPTFGGSMRWLGKLLTAPDAVFRWSDPLPYAGQLALLGELARVGRARGVSLLEASTIDMEWNGEA